MPPTKKKLEGLKISLASLVDDPAQEHAKILMVKGKRPPLPPTAGDGAGVVGSIVKAYVADEDCTPMLTTSTDGHQHMLFVPPGARAGETNYATGTGAQASGHTHSWLVVDGAVVLAEVVGHTHDVDADLTPQSAVVAAVTEALADGAAAVIDALEATHVQAGRGAKIDNAESHLYNDPKETDAMADENTTIQKLTADLAKATAWGNLTDAEKSHALSLPEGSERDGFVTKSRGERAVEIEKSAAADPIAYTCADGTAIRKSAGALVLKLAKEGDELRTANATATAKARKLELRKRVDEEVPAIAGSDEVKVAVLEAIDGIEDAEVKKAATEMMKACNGAFSQLLKSTGSRKSAGESGSTLEGSRDALKAHVTKRAAELGVDYYVALKNLSASDKVTRDLLEKIDAEKEAATA